MADKIGKWLKEARQHVAAGHIERGEGLCRRILDIAPDHAGAMLVLARALYFRRETGEAIERLESVLQHEPENADARILLIYIHAESGGDTRAVELAHEILEGSENPGELLAAYLAFDLMCEWKHTRQLLPRILDLATQGKVDNGLMPSLLMAMNTAPDISPERIFELHRIWGDRLESETRQQQLPGEARPPVDGRLKIGYLSADFYKHPVGHFIQSPITHHDRDRFEVYCYANVVIDDERTARIRESADHFIDVTQLSPYEIAQRIHKDGIHILVELGGHTALSRLMALAFRPAPVQITYLGYPNTTGLSTVDFRISDAFAEDTEQGTQYVEQLLYMPQSFLCAEEFMQDVPRAEVTPATRNGYITFGSFNHVRKLNPETIALWSRILQGVEKSRLVIKSNGCDVPMVRDNILDAFARHGIEAERIRFYALIKSHAEHAAIYNEVDIALDSFPYNGTTTTCETLWIGVPVISLVGPQHVQRTSYSILKNIGLDATIAHTPDEYVDKAINLSKNLDNLNMLRQCLPTLIKHSPLGQPETFTHQLEALYEHAWQTKGYALPAKATAPPEPVTPPQALPGCKEQRRLLLCDRLDPLTWHTLRTHCDAVASGNSKAWLVVVIPPVAQRQRIGTNILGYLQHNYLHIQQLANVHVLLNEGDTGPLLAQCAAAYVIEAEGGSQASMYQEKLKAAAESAGCPILPVTPAAITADRAAVQPMPPLHDFKVTVCVPTYNRCKLLKRAVNTVLCQSYENLELLISDNASDDGTEAFCHALTARDPRVRYHRNAANIGAVENFFQLYEMLETDLFIICSDDDFLEPGFLQKAVDMYIAHPELGMVYGPCNIVDMEEKVGNRLDFTNTVDCIVDPRHELLESLLRNQVIWTSAMMRKTATQRMLQKAESMFGLDFQGIVSRYTDYLFDALMLSEAPAGYIDTVCANFTINPDSMSSGLLARGVDIEALTMPKVYELYDAVYGIDPAARRALRAGVHIRSNTLQAVLEEANRLPPPAQLETLGRIRTVSDQLNALLERATETPASAPQTEDTPLTPQDWTRHVADAAKAYGERPHDESVHNQLRALRAVFAQTWLSMANEDMSASFKPFEEGYRSLLLSGLRYEPLLGDEKVLIQGLLEQLEQQPVQHNMPALMTAMLYCQPHTLPLCTTPEDLPAWFLDLYLDFMHTAPELFQRAGETEQYLQTMTTWVNLVHAGVTTGKSPSWQRIGERFALGANFIPIYMTHENLKDLYVKRAEIMASFLKTGGHRLEHRFGPRPSPRQKIRLGILANHFSPQTETFATLPFYEHLDRSRFEIILLSMAESGHRLEQYCRQHADQFVYLQGPLPENAQRIRALDLDMLLVASNVTAVCNLVTLLAEYRLARVQISSVASCVTSGMSHVDFYISGSYTEPEHDAQAQYQESLIMVDGPAHCYNFATEDEAPTLAVDRKQLGIAENAVVYASGSNYYKITPEVEDTWARILANDPNAHLVLYPFNPNWSSSYATRPFISRLVASFQHHGVDQKRITFLEPLPHQADIKAILALCDVYLDSFPFAGVTSLLDPLAVGMPVVTMKGNSFRSMMGGALLRELDVRELIVDGIDAYVELAVRLGGDSALRQAFITRILAGMQASPRFLDSRSYGKAIERLFLGIAAEKLGIEDMELCP